MLSELLLVEPLKRYAIIKSEFFSECSSPDITNEQFNLGFYINEDEIEPKFVGVVKEFDVENVNSICKNLKKFTDEIFQ